MRLHYLRICRAMLKRKYIVKKITMYGTRLIAEYDTLEKAQAAAKEIEEANLDSFTEDFIKVEQIDYSEKM